jgi:hypothetical protein
MRLGSSVGIATDCGPKADVRVPEWLRFLFTPQRPRLLQPVFLTMGKAASFPGCKGAGRKADHSTSATVIVKNDGAEPPLPHRCPWRDT